MTILDSYAVIAHLRGEPAARRVVRLLEAGDAALTTVGVVEALDQLIRVDGVDEEEATLDLAELELLEPVPLDGLTAMAAGRLRAGYYHRTRCAVSLADCVTAETARTWSEPLAAADPHLLDVCHAERIPVIPLPGSDGSVWAPR